MPINVLVINSSPEKNSLLAHAFKELARKGFSFNLWSSKTGLIEQFKKNNWPAKKIFLGPDAKKNIIFFSLLLLPRQLIFLISLIKLKIKRRIDLVICLDFNEKILATAPARLLGLKVVWLEDPDINYQRVNKLLLRLYKNFYRLAKVIVFNSYGKSQLINLRHKNINLIAPGAKLSQYQDNIFNKLAASSQTNSRRKYFTVGAITELNQKQKIESIFQAVRICLPVIPNLQLIIIGGGRERKNLLWLSKKMEIENLVWLVGEQEQLKKWLDSFDIFLALNDCPKLDDYGNILEAMAAGLPVLGLRNIGLEDLIIENKTGSLIESDNSEMLARQIIKLHQDKKLRLYLGKNGQERAAQLFPLNKMVNELEKILKE